MSQSLVLPSLGINLPVIVADERAQLCFLEFFTAQIRNSNTQRAYARAVNELLSWCHAVGVPDLIAVGPLHVASWIERQTQTLAAPSVQQRLAAIQHCSPVNRRNWSTGTFMRTCATKPNIVICTSRSERL